MSATPATAVARAPPARSFVRRVACPACEAPPGRTVYRCGYAEEPVRSYLTRYYEERGAVELDRVEGAAYVLLECGACGLVYQEDVPGPDLLSRIYDVWIDPARSRAVKRAKGDLEHGAARAQEIMTFVAMLRKPPTALRFLDFGMGWGDWARMARAFGVDVAGADLAGSRAEGGARDGVRILTLSDVAHEQFDLVNAEQVFEHLVEPLPTLRALAAGLAPGGLVHVSVPGDPDVLRKLRAPDWRAPKGSRASLNAVAPLEHVNAFSHRSLVALGARVGLRPVRVPVRMQLAYPAALVPPRAAARRLARAAWRGLVPGGTNVVFRRVEARA